MEKVAESWGPLQQVILILEGLGAAGGDQCFHWVADSHVGLQCSDLIQKARDLCGALNKDSVINESQRRGVLVKFLH